MLEEIIAGFLTLFTSFTADIPHLSRSKTVTESSRNEPLHECAWPEDGWHTEDGTVNDKTTIPVSCEYIGEMIHVKPTFQQSLIQSIKTNLSINLAVFLLATIGIAVLYFDIRTTDLCFEWRTHNHTIPLHILRVKLIGDCVQGIVLSLWFPTTMIVLFGWSEFKRHYTLILLTGLIFGLMSILYLTFLMVYNVYDTKVVYRVPGNVIFAINLLVATGIVVRKIREIHPNVSYSNVQIMTVISAEILASFAISMYYRYLAVPWFNMLKNETWKFFVALLTPLLTLLPTAFCHHMALRRSSEIIQPQRSFVLVYIMRGSSITLYRIMQANFQNLWLFLGLSFFSGFSYVFKTITWNIRNKMWAHIIQLLKANCCTNLRQLPVNTPHSRRLKADIEIQNIIFENNSLIISQAFLALYMISSFELSEWTFIKKSLSRLAIGLAIEFFFNTLSVFFHIHWYVIPIPRVWSKCWRRHVFANAVILVMTVCYFTGVLLSVFQVRMHNPSEIHVIKNCTMHY